MANCCEDGDWRPQPSIEVGGGLRLVRSVKEQLNGVESTKLAAVFRMMDVRPAWLPLQTAPQYSCC